MAEIASVRKLDSAVLTFRCASVANFGSNSTSNCVSLILKLTIIKIHRQKLI